MIQRILICFPLLLLTTGALGQNYGTAIGLRLGTPVGLTVKSMLSADKAAEGILYVRNRGLGLTILIEKHADAFGTSSIQWFMV